ncbi:uncharacterized protein PRCAT00004742001 [Priceomyces carsonii]|uniref:uncharacterized protein n=1 Tax=Priceomyces carsonii TaxID=28549 RepID=UPI002ED9E6EE|nr:unnamed protein product [Priceomyces carsonii]
MASISNPHTRKTRRRVSKSCFLCRKRKLKCDRNLPCQNCFESKKTELCIYERQLLKNDHTLSASEAETLALSEELKSSKEKINNLTSLVQLFSKDTSERAKRIDAQVNDNDLKLDLYENFDLMTYEKGDYVRMGLTSMMSLILNDTYWGTLFVEYLGSRFPQTRAPESDDIKNSDQLKEINIASEVERARKIFPKVSLVVPLVDCFFKYGASSASILDKDSFLLEIGKILSPDESIKFNLKKRKHYVLLAELLVILRSAFVSLPQTNEKGSLSIVNFPNGQQFES